MMKEVKVPKHRLQPEAQPFRKAGKISAGLVMLLIVGGIALYLTSNSRTVEQGRSGGFMASPALASSVPGQDFRIPVSEVNDKARFYDYRLANGKNIKFFAIKSSDGVIRAALDACIICYRFRLGYHQEGDDMVCNKCKRHFRSIDVNVKSGACNPIPLARTVEGHTLVIRSADLEQGAIYF